MYLVAYKHRLMKKSVLLCLLALQCMVALAQSPCKDKHRIFNIPKDKTPAVITKLGVSPQFVPLRHVVDKNVYFRNLKALANDAKYKDEINSLFTAIGYKGVSDPAFTIDRLESATLPFGAIGMLGDGKHNYVYSLLALTNQRNIPCWVIRPAVKGCTIYIMNECGNAFYYSNPNTETITYIDRCNGSAKVKVKVYARYSTREECQCNDCENTVQIKEIEENALLASEKIENIPILPEKASYPVKRIYIDVDKATFKRIKEYDVNGKYSKHTCDETCGSECDESCGSECTHSCHK